MMLERLHKRQVACTVAAFFALLFLCLLIGALGPAALVQSHGSGRTLRCQGEGCDATWRGNLTSMSPLNQVRAVSSVCRVCSETAATAPVPRAHAQRRVICI